MVENTLCKICNIDKVAAKGMCRPCYQKDYNNRNRDKIYTVSRAWSQEHKENVRAYTRTPKAKFQNLRSSARSRSLDFTITEKQYLILIQTHCYYCDGFFPLLEAGGGLDRLDNDLGYNIDNVVSCCSICNQTRNDNWSPEETRIIIQAGINFRRSNQNV